MLPLERKIWAEVVKKLSLNLFAQLRLLIVFPIDYIDQISFEKSIYIVTYTRHGIGFDIQTLLFVAVDIQFFHCFKMNLNFMEQILMKLNSNFDWQNIDYFQKMENWKSLKQAEFPPILTADGTRP